MKEELLETERTTPDGKNFGDLEELTSQSLEQTPKPEKLKSKVKVKVDLDRVETALDLVGELVVLKSQLRQAEQDQKGQEAVVRMIDTTVKELHDKLLFMRMTPLKPLFLKAQRALKDLAIKQEKPIDVILKGEETEIDRVMIEGLGDPLSHLIRNAFDHGIENEHTRLRNDKPKTGTIGLEAKQAGGRILLKVWDDGRGLNLDSIYEKGLAMGLIPANLTREDIDNRKLQQLIFEHGFTTTKEATDLSGRGVGLDVVKSNIEDISGKLTVESNPGKGTSFTVSLPLTTSITEGIVLIAGHRKYIIPLENVVQFESFDPTKIVKTDEQTELVRIRDDYLPIHNLDSLLNATLEVFDQEYGAQPQALHAPDRKILLIVEDNEDMLALKVDHIVGQNQFVIKPMNQALRNTSGVVGVSILGDGSVAMVLDIEEINIKLSGGNYGRAA